MKTQKKNVNGSRAVEARRRWDRSRGRSPLSNKRFILSVSLVLVLLLAGLLYYFAFGVIKASYSIPMVIEVSSKLGIAGDTGVLNFGVVQPGGWSKKTLVLANNRAYPLEVIMTPSGNISPYIVFSENFFLLNASGTRTVGVWVQTPVTIRYGQYDGRLNIIMKR